MEIVNFSKLNFTVITNTFRQKNQNPHLGTNLNAKIIICRHVEVYFLRNHKYVRLGE